MQRLRACTFPYTAPIVSQRPCGCDGFRCRRAYDPPCVSAILQYDARVTRATQVSRTPIEAERSNHEGVIDVAPRSETHRQKPICKQKPSQSSSTTVSSSHCGILSPCQHANSFCVRGLRRRMTMAKVDRPADADHFPSSAPFPDGLPPPSLAPGLKL